MTRPRPSTRRILLWGLLALAVLVVVLNWTYGRLPATPRPTGRFLQLAGLKIRYLERSGPGPAVLLIHGLPGTAEDFEAVTPLIKGHRTIAIDRPGYGFSTGGYFPFDRQLQAVHEVIEKLHLGHPILVGHSYGGAISLAYAERHPSEVRGLVLVDAAATCTRNSAFARAQARFVKLVELPVVSQVANATFSQLLRTASADPAESEAFSPNGVNQRHHQRVLAINLKHGNLEAYSGETVAANGVIEALDRGLHGIQQPAIVLQGAQDKLVKPECGRRLAASLPDAHLQMVQGGHMVPYTHPAAVAAAVEALARQR
ncbi:MAG TPA: alpha/beta hydrolase [Solirubrobacteraceae bacterium]|jgi:pimeloyl-ACP methyl ester carboxylesterase|nr:alpha/beta hydrolase [Solirubrobacteraceae bacterium]